MAERVALHVGAMKSGTSYIQSQLFANREELARQGVLVPGNTWGDQVRGTLDVLGRSPHGFGDVTGAWRKLVDQVDAWSGTAVISMEFFGPVAPPLIRQVTGSFRDAEVTAIITLRDLNRSIAAMWQETVQNGRHWTWPEYLDGVYRARPRPERTAEDMTLAGRTFWRQQSIVRMARRWSGVLGRDRVALVTVPPPGARPELLMERFAEVVGFDSTPLKAGPTANQAVGAASAQVLRRMNELLAERELEFPLGAQMRKFDLAKQVLGARRKQEPAIGLPVADWVVAQAAKMVGNLQSYRLVGDWSDLDPVPVPGIDPTTVPAEEVFEAAVAGLAGLVETSIRREAELAQAPALP